MSRSTEEARWAMDCTIYELEAVLHRLIPVPDARTHNVALALDELIREARAAYEEM